MNAKELLTTRRSVRRFLDERVSRETINEILDIAKYAPSWKNFQVARFNIVEDRSIITKIAETGVNEFVYNTKTLEKANQICVISYKKGLSGNYEDGKQATSKNDWEVFDAGITTLQFCLAAQSVGVHTVIMGIFDEKITSELINLPSDEAVGAIVVFGYPKFDNPVAPKRKELSELARFMWILPHLRHTQYILKGGKFLDHLVKNKNTFDGVFLWRPLEPKQAF